MKNLFFLISLFLAVFFPANVHAGGNRQSTQVESINLEIVHWITARHRGMELLLTEEEPVTRPGTFHSILFDIVDKYGEAVWGSWISLSLEGGEEGDYVEPYPDRVWDWDGNEHTAGRLVIGENRTKRTLTVTAALTTNPDIYAAATIKVYPYFPEAEIDGVASLRFDSPTTSKVYLHTRNIPDGTYPLKILQQINDWHRSIHSEILMPELEIIEELPEGLFIDSYTITIKDNVGSFTVTSDGNIDYYPIRANHFWAVVRVGECSADVRIPIVFTHEPENIDINNHPRTRLPGHGTMPIYLRISDKIGWTVHNLNLIWEIEGHSEGDSIGEGEPVFFGNYANVRNELYIGPSQEPRTITIIVTLKDYPDVYAATTVTIDPDFVSVPERIWVSSMPWQITDNSAAWVYVTVLNQYREHMPDVDITWTLTGHSEDFIESFPWDDAGFRYVGVFQSGENFDRRTVTVMAAATEHDHIFGTTSISVGRNPGGRFVYPEHIISVREISDMTVHLEIYPEWSLFNSEKHVSVYLPHGISVTNLKNSYIIETQGGTVTLGLLELSEGLGELVLSADETAEPGAFHVGLRTGNAGTVFLFEQE